MMHACHPESTCQVVVWRKRSRGVMGKGTESYTKRAEPCGGELEEGHDICAKHLSKLLAMRGGKA